MRTLPTTMLLACGLLGSLGSLGCGGGSDPLPLISGSVTGSYDGDSFTATSGFATVYEGTTILGLGDGDLNCGSPEMNDPPPGYNAIIALPSFDVGTSSNVFVQMFRNVSAFEGVGSNDGTVTITASTNDSVAGTVAYSYTDLDGKTFTLSGTFEVTRCP